MASILLVGASPPGLKRLKTILIKRGFEVTALEADELTQLGQSKERFVLGLVDANGAGSLSKLVSQIRGQEVTEELPLMALVKEGQLSELDQISPLEDFLITPATPELVEARVKFLLKRLSQMIPGSGICVGSLELNIDRYEVLLEGEPLELTYKEFELLKFLATHPNRVFSRDQLLNQVWGYDFIGGTRTVDVHIRRLRSKLGPQHAALIDTVRNVGYKFLETL